MHVQKTFVNRKKAFLRPAPNNNYWDDYGWELGDIVGGSFLEEYDELNIEVNFKQTAAASVKYELFNDFSGISVDANAFFFDLLRAECFVEVQACVYCFR